jgi:hypothetical protein
MSNTCTICRHKEGEGTESALAQGQPLRDIARQFETSKDAVNRHQTCIAAELKTLKATRSFQLNESLLQRLDRYRLRAEQFLEDDEKLCLPLIAATSKLT